MPNKQLSDYVRQQFKQGKNKDEIKSELLEIGWQETDIDRAFSISDASQPPRPPVPSLTPSHTSTGQRQLNPKAVWLFFLRSVLVLVFIIFWTGFSVTALLPQVTPFIFENWLVILVGVLTFSFIWAKLTYHFYRYELTEDGFRKESGVISKKYVTIPYDRIQNVDIYRGVLARILKLSDLHIQTAGMGASGAGAEGRLLAISREVAEEVRDELIRRSRQTKNQGL